MIQHMLKIFGLFCLALCLAQGVSAQKNKIKGKQATTGNDSTRQDSTRAVPGGKGAIKKSTASTDSLAPAIPDSLRATLIQRANAAQDSVQSGTRDSLVPPRKRFYTRVKASELESAEARAEGLEARIAIAESRLEGYRKETAAGEKTGFNEQQLADFATSIALARQKLGLADSSLLAVRNKLASEGRLKPSDPASGESPLPEEDSEEDESGDLPEPSAVTPGGKGSLKGAPAEPPAKSGKGNLKGGKQQEEDIDED